MKLRNLLFNVLLLSSVIPMGCDKKNDNDGGDSLATQQISASSWKISTVTAAGTDVSALLPDCYLDNVVTFYADLKGKVEESAVVCDPTTAGNFSWAFNDTETKITLSAALIPGGNNVFNLVSVNATTLVLSQETTLIPAPFPVEVVVTLVH
ncbi:MAG: hypothetical protein EOO05_19305 [Chitinophagaceae bacterium]|nr:MAG: hypothetical protein EOO05_19305 [Chitinophagaceae bacterium]